ncbi:MAG: 50S ribosomal protein L24 [Candidatus Wildermuthbacteria bacterium RIFCSPHIGHO2_12_FULL_45_9]|uniref:Large ribosomal subunit protein uL24 n=1 Tax=Candidatus Wildermuthbacteria bacterium RIFCSPHIGHO2_02_FULL_45_25 TaxID=1802450 RepID=A0A1G2R5R8_9BACT|nr:MAG: 50S ribosomal protein L24 [Candidatus Wildermuthbacteria bacterium RIFCSPHIGHO2_01_FULL_45_20]OHA67908.1 MAG: 50S ribosomal protein L24 [Candidatus Wildermuthbacteria bacterium RIFCSPHIGHO2_02_FULL_45_25]OHA70572.1 MAG: 50S ribosomal protein L24 [Candidatus Wildermuthbacteria bacterium RIFCSPHIGHO2_12_FULL_45_9]
MKIKKGDNVLVIAGKDRGRKGKVLQALPKEQRVVVEGMNMRKRHTKPRRQGQKGQIVEKPAAFAISNVKLICEKCGKAVRVGYRVEEENKYRICKKCGAQV